MSDAPTSPDPRQTRYEQQRAEWQRDVWAALEERRQQAAVDDRPHVVLGLLEKEGG